MPESWPLIHRCDIKCNGLISEAIRHLAKTDIDTRQPGYSYLLGNVFKNLPEGGEKRRIVKTCQDFIAHGPARRPPVEDNAAAMKRFIQSIERFAGPVPKPLSEKAKKTIARREQYMIR